MELPHGPEYALPDGRAHDQDWELTPKQVHTLLQRGESVVVLDVREIEELTAAKLPDDVQVLAIPMGEVAQRISEIEEAADEALIVTMCHGGVRSFQVAAFLRKEAEIEHVYS
ncbi:MAG: rhodanese-like domain-containing protein, partial [Planctomycetota bacterium]